MQRRKRSRGLTLSQRLAAAFFVALFFPTLVVVVIVYRFVTRFVPDDRLAWLTDRGSGVALLLAFFAVLYLMRKNLKDWSLSGRMGGLRSLVVSLIAAAVVTCLWHLFVVKPLPYLLYLTNSTIPSVREELVVGTSRGGRRCRNRVIFAGRGRALCNVTRAEIELLSQGGRVHLVGRESRYGFEYTRYTIIPAAR